MPAFSTQSATQALSCGEAAAVAAIKVEQVAKLQITRLIAIPFSLQIGRNCFKPRNPRFPKADERPSAMAVPYRSRVDSNTTSVSQSMIGFERIIWHIRAPGS